MAEDKKRELPFDQVECLACSFKNLSTISNLWGLDKLVKLQLDNNRIGKIENLSHLVGEELLGICLAMSSTQGIHALVLLVLLSSAGGVHASSDILKRWDAPIRARPKHVSL